MSESYKVLFFAGLSPFARPYYVTNDLTKVSKRTKTNGPIVRVTVEPSGRLAIVTCQYENKSRAEIHVRSFDGHAMSVALGLIERRAPLWGLEKVEIDLDGPIVAAWARPKSRSGTW